MHRREPLSTADRVYVTLPSYKSVGCCYGFRRYTNCTHPLNPPPCGGLFVARRARSEWSPDAGNIARVWIGSVHTLPECFAARTAIATAAPFYNPDPTPTPPSGGAFVARCARSGRRSDAIHNFASMFLFSLILDIWLRRIYTRWAKCKRACFCSRLFSIFGFAEYTLARQNASELAFALAYSYICPNNI